MGAVIFKVKLPEVLFVPPTFNVRVRLAVTAATVFVPPVRVSVPLPLVICTEAEAVTPVGRLFTVAV
jgi:hypothetical protein